MRSNALVYILSVAAAMFIGWSLFNPSFSGTIEYTILLAFFVMIAWSALVFTVPGRAERGYLISIFMVALALRILVSTVIHKFLPPGYFAPDEEGILFNGRWFAEALAQPGRQYGHPDSPATIAALVFYLFGYRPNILFLLVNFLGALSVLNIYFITKRLFNIQSARYSAAIVTALPSLVLWTSLATKDPYSQFLITSIVHLVLRVKERFRIGNVVLIVVLIVLIGFIRGYLLVIVLIAVASAIIPLRGKTFIRNTIIIAAFAVSFSLFFSSYESKTVSKSPGQQSVFQTLQQTRSGFYTGGSRMLGAINISSPVNVLIYAPLLLSVFFLAPFPWDITASLLHNLATAEGLVWYFFFYYAIKGIIEAFRKENFNIMPVLVMIGVLSIAYSLAITNMGAAYRFRGQVSGLLLVFSGYGLYLRNQAKMKGHSATGTDNEEPRSDARDPA